MRRMSIRLLIEGLRAVPVRAGIKLVLMQVEKGTIAKMDAPESPTPELKELDGNP